MPNVNGYFKVVIEMEDEGGHKDFKEAMKIFMNRCFNLVNNGTSFQVLESLCWIEFNDDPRSIMYFYALRDMADELGWTVDGKWID